MASAPATTAAVEEEVQVVVSPAGLGRITLCRERQLNALGAEHVERMHRQLLAWAAPAAAAGGGVRAVLLESCTPRALCSGGDVKAARAAVLGAPYADAPPDGHHIHRVFRAEYSALLSVSSYPLPFVAVCQGIWMGLGFGLAGFGRYRVVSDDTTFAMPENAIGLWPDVGFAFKAAGMPGRLGLLLGLTGVRLASPADLLFTGLATHYIPAGQLQAFKAQLADAPEQLEALLDAHSRPPPDAPGPLQRVQGVVDGALDALALALRRPGGCDEAEELRRLASRLEQALPAVRAADHGAAHLLEHALHGLGYASPRSMALTAQWFLQVAGAVEAAGGRSGGGPGTAPGGQPDLSTLRGVMHMEYRMAVRQVAHEDFLEGVRAALVDKDRQPAWLRAGRDGQGGSGGSGGGSGAPEKRRPLPGNRFPIERCFEPLPAGHGPSGDHLA